MFTENRYISVGKVDNTNYSIKGSIGDTVFCIRDTVFGIAFGIVNI